MISFSPLFLETILYLNSMGKSLAKTTFFISICHFRRRIDKRKDELRASRLTKKEIWRSKTWMMLLLLLLQKQIRIKQPAKRYMCEIYLSYWVTSLIYFVIRVSHILRNVIVLFWCICTCSFLSFLQLFIRTWKQVNDKRIQYASLKFKFSVKGNINSILHSFF